MSVEVITKQLYRCKCERPECAYQWEPETVPQRCPKCKSRRWNRLPRLSAKRMLTFNGKTQGISQWAKELGISRYAVTWRFNQGWPMEQVLSKEDWRIQQ